MEAVLVINNSECFIQGLSVPQLKELRGLLSYEKTASQAFSQAFYAGVGYKATALVSTKGVFATGLLHNVLNWLLNNSIEFDIRDLRKTPKASPGMFKASLGVTPYPHQTNAVEEACSSIRGIVSAVTGVGKSLMMAMLIQKLQMKTLIIVPTLGLRSQLRASMQDWFGNLENITIENIDSPKLKNCTDYDLLLIDEAHHVAAKTYRKLNKTAWTGIYHRYCFTATPFRSREEEHLLFESIAGQVLCEIDYQTAVENKYIVPVEAYYIEIPKTEIKGNERSWASMYSELVVMNETRNHIISDLLVSLKDKSTLCLVKEIKHGSALGGYFAHGENSDTPHLITLFNRGKLKTLVGTTGVLGEGVDTRPAEYVIIAGLGKSRPQFMQQIGRGVRNYPGKTSCKVIIFLDKSHKWTRTHLREQCKILLEYYGVVPSKLEL